MQGRNPSTAIPDPDQKRKQRLRMLRNCTIVVLVVVLIVLAVNLGKVSVDNILFRGLLGAVHILGGGRVAERARTPDATGRAAPPRIAPVRRGRE